MKNNMLSIIIPVYNVRYYLPICLNSILNQDVSFDYEIILIDDGSVDGSANICDDYSLNYSNIKVVHQANRGLGGARNRGINEATGKYIWFVDSDDEVCSGALLKLDRIFSCTNTDIISFPFLRSNGKNTCKMGDVHRPLPYQIISSRVYFEKYQIVISACFQVIKRSVIVDNSLAFIEGVFHEDHDFTLKLYYYAEDIIYIEQPLYKYIIRDQEESITSSKSVLNYKKRISDLLFILKELENFSEAYAIDVEKRYYLKRYIDNHINYMLRLLWISPILYTEKKNILKRFASHDVFRLNRHPIYLNRKNLIFDIISRVQVVFRLLLYFASHV